MTTRKRTAVPRLRRRTVTAYALCQAVVRAVRAEPRRLNMNVWGFRVEPGDKYSRPRPSCGYVGCLAGWVELLATGSLSGDSGSVARTTLAGAHGDGINEMQRSLYFDVFVSSACLDAAHAGTKGHVEKALVPFLAWMRKYKTQLQARTVHVTRPAAD